MGITTIEAMDAKCRERSAAVDQRLDALEKNHRALQDIATSIKLIAQRQDDMSADMEKLADKVEGIEQKPAKRWEAVVTAALLALVGAVVGYVLGQVGL